MVWQVKPHLQMSGNRTWIQASLMGHLNSLKKQRRETSIKEEKRAASLPLAQLTGKFRCPRVKVKCCGQNGLKISNSG